MPFLIVVGVAFHYFLSGRKSRGLFTLLGGIFFVDFFVYLAWIKNQREITSSIVLGAFYAFTASELGSLIFKAIKRKSKSWENKRQKLFMKAGEMLAKNDLSSALKILKKIHKHDPWDPAPLMWLAFCYAKKRKRFSAYNALSKALALDKKNEWAFLGIKIKDLIHPITNKTNFPSSPSRLKQKVS